MPGLALHSQHTDRILVNSVSLQAVIDIKGDRPIPFDQPIPKENKINISTLAFASVYYSIIDIPGVIPLALATFIHILFAWITFAGIRAF